MAKVKVQRFRTSPAQFVLVDPAATEGARVGVNLLDPDGNLITAEAWSTLTSPQTGGSGLTTTDDLDEGAYHLYFTTERAQDAAGALATDSDNVTLTYDDDAGTLTADLTDLTDSGAGTFKLLTRDAKGRLSGTVDGTTDDVPEGDDNIYFTAERAQAAVVADGITDGDTTHAPSGDVVHDALALKIDTSEKAAANGVATLGADAKLDPGQLPALAITETFVVDDEAAMLALDCEQGDVAVRTDLSESFILTADPPSTLSNWQELLTPTGGVTSFNGRTGSVTPATGDYTPAQVGAEPAIDAGTTSQYWRGDKSWQTLNKAAVGLGNVDNTGDADKPVSTAQQTALDLKYDKTGGDLSGNMRVVKATTVEAQFELDSGVALARHFYRDTDFNYGMYLTGADGVTKTRFRFDGTNMSVETPDLKFAGGLLLEASGLLDTSPTISDLDSLGGGVSRFFSASGGSTGIPSAVSTAGGCGHYVAFNATNGSMTWHSLGPNRLFVRTYNSGSWAAWKEAGLS